MSYLSGDFVDSTPILSDAQALRRNAQDEGYLFFKHLLPRDAVTKLRADMLSVVEQYQHLHKKIESLEQAPKPAPLQ